MVKTFINEKLVCATSNIIEIDALKSLTFIRDSTYYINSFLISKDYKEAIDRFYSGMDLGDYKNFTGKSGFGEVIIDIIKKQNNFKNNFYLIGTSGLDFIDIRQLKNFIFNNNEVMAILIIERSIKNIDFKIK